MDTLCKKSKMAIFFFLLLVMGKTKSKKRSFFDYSEENMRNAIDAVRNGMSKKRASKEFNVPRTTLVRKLSGKCLLQRKMGPACELSEKEENVLVAWILAMAKKGFPIHRTNLVQSVKKYLIENNRPVRYFNETLTPGRAWYEGFLKRHPNIKEKQAESVSKARAAVTKDRIHNWFDEIYRFFEEENLLDILLDPSRIFNADEAGFALCPKSGKVLGPTKCEEDFYVRVNCEKEQITVMGNFSADGKVVPPMIILPYKKIPKVIVESVPENWGLGRSESGWINSEVFFEYISNHFLKYVKDNDILRPVVLFVDGHRSHLTQQVSRFCDDNGIILISLLPNTTHIMQPADVSVFKPLKSGWKSAVRTWKFENFPKDVTRYTFGCIIKEVFEKFATASTIQNGFRRSGLFPFDRNNVDYTKCIPNRSMIAMEKANIKENTDLKLKVLNAIESKINKEELDNFYHTYTEKSVWRGSIESVNLFKVWSSIKDDCAAISPVTGECELAGIQMKTKDNVILSNLENASISNNINSTSPSTSIAKTKNNCVEDNSQNIDASRNIAASPLPSTSAIKWHTPERDHAYTYRNKENEGFKVPTPFKDCLPFPKTPEKKTPPKRRKVIFPAVVSSGKYRDFYENEKITKITPKQKKNKLKEINPKYESSSDSDVSLSFNDDDMDISDTDDLNLQKGKYVIVKYEDKYYPGKLYKSM